MNIRILLSLQRVKKCNHCAARKAGIGNRHDKNVSAKIKEYHKNRKGMSQHLSFNTQLVFANLALTTYASLVSEAAAEAETTLSN